MSDSSLSLWAWHSIGASYTLIAGMFRGKVSESYSRVLNTASAAVSLSLLIRG